jgi:hypothetical protein
MPDMLAFALLICAGLWLIAHRYTMAELLVRDGLLRQFGIEGREEKTASLGVVLVGALALLLSGLLRLAG